MTHTPADFRAEMHFAELCAQLRAMKAERDAALAALARFLADERFEVAVGGNTKLPFAVEAMLQQARAIYGNKNGKEDAVRDAETAAYDRGLEDAAKVAADRARVEITGLSLGPDATPLAIANLFNQMTATKIAADIRARKEEG